MRLPDAELKVLKALWELGPSSIRELAAKCYDDSDVSAYSTVQKLLERLMAKSCVGRRRQGRHHLYHASIQRQDLIDHRLRETAEKLCEGSMTPLISRLIDSNRLSRQELESLRRLIDELESRLAEGGR